MNLESCHKCGERPRRVKIQCACGTFVECAAGGIKKAIEVWNRQQMRKRDGSTSAVYAIGDDVMLRPYDDLKAIVRAVYIEEDGLKYECAWFRSDGSRSTEYFSPCELELVEKKPQHNRRAK